MKPIIPKNNDYFVATSYLSNHQEKASSTLYRFTDGVLGPLAHPVCHLRNSYERGSSLYPFEIDMAWLKQHKINIVTENDALQIFNREMMFDAFIKDNSKHFFESNYFKFDIDADKHEVVPLSENFKMLRIAKLNESTFLRLSKKSFKHVSHISDRGELIFNIKNGFKKIDIQNVEVEFLQRFFQVAKENGFKEKPEDHLTNQDRKVLRRTTSPSHEP